MERDLVFSKLVILDQWITSPLPSITLNEKELTRIVFSSQQNDGLALFDSEKFAKFRSFAEKMPKIAWQKALCSVRSNKVDKKTIHEHPLKIKDCLWRLCA